MCRKWLLSTHVEGELVWGCSCPIHLSQAYSLCLLEPLRTEKNYNQRALHRADASGFTCFTACQSLTFSSFPAFVFLTKALL